MARLPKDEWLKERHLDIEWAPAGVPKLIQVDNGKEFHSLALRRGCERYAISLEYRPPGRPQFGAHIERYLGTLMRRIHGLPGTTYSNPIERGKYRSEARATMTMAALERWMALEIAGSLPPTRPSWCACHPGAALGEVHTPTTATCGHRPSALCDRLSPSRWPTRGAKRLSNQPNSLLGPYPLPPVPAECTEIGPPRPSGPIPRVCALPHERRISCHSLCRSASSADYAGRTRTGPNPVKRQRARSAIGVSDFCDDRGLSGESNESPPIAAAARVAISPDSR